MKTLKIKFIGIVLSFLALSGQAQNFSLTPNIGVASKFLDESHGYAITLNPNLALSDYVVFEGQLAYQEITITGSFLSGNTGWQKIYGGHVGAKFFVLSRNYKFRPFANILGGVNHTDEYKDGYGFKPQEYATEVSVSLGLGAEIADRFVITASINTPSSLILTAGYKFNLTKKEND